MSRPLRIQYPGACYYISQHSQKNKPVFRTDQDREKFLDILVISLENYNVKLHAFVLMEDHFHLIVETPSGNLSQCMRHLNISYTSYFNRLYRRKGNLYRGRFKSIVIEKDSHLSKLSIYLHANPAKKRKKHRAATADEATSLAAWKWSSLPGYLGMYPRYSIVDYADVLEPFGGDTPSGRKEYFLALQNHLANGYCYKPDVVGQVILGSPEFIAEMELILSDKNQKSGSYIISNTDKSQSLNQILDELTICLHCSQEQLLREPSEARDIAIDMLYRFTEMNNPQIGDLFNLDFSSISIYRTKLRSRRKDDPMLHARMTLVENRLRRLLASAPE